MYLLVRATGIEPAASRVQTEHSTSELRPDGVGEGTRTPTPVAEDFKSPASTVSPHPHELVPPCGIEPPSPAYKTGPHPLKASRALVRVKGFEPPCLATAGPKPAVSTVPPHPHIGAREGSRTLVTQLRRPGTSSAGTSIVGEPGGIRTHGVLSHAD